MSVESVVYLTASTETRDRGIIPNELLSHIQMYDVERRTMSERESRLLLGESRSTVGCDRRTINMTEAMAHQLCGDERYGC